MDREELRKRAEEALAAPPSWYTMTPGQVRTSTPQRMMVLDPGAILALLDECEEYRKALKATADELDEWGWGDMHYGSQGQEQRVVDAVAEARRVLSFVAPSEEKGSHE